MSKSPFANNGYNRVNKVHRSHINAGPQITPRLEEFFRIAGQQGALSFDHVQRWFARLSPEPERLKLPGELSVERTRKILRPWLDEELFCYRVIFSRQKAWIWLSQKGLKYTGLNLRYYEPSPASLPHLYAVNEARLLLEDRRPGDTWRSERELRAELNGTTEETRRHMPDAELVTDKGIIAIEVEITLKAEKRLHEILVDLAPNNRYYTIWYFCSDQVHKALAKEIEKLPPRARTMFRLYDLQGQEKSV
jgi:hypothetical protein